MQRINFLNLSKDICEHLDRFKLAYDSAKLSNNEQPAQTHRDLISIIKNSWCQTPENSLQFTCPFRRIPSVRSSHLSGSVIKRTSSYRQTWRCSETTAFMKALRRTHRASVPVGDPTINNRMAPGNQSDRSFSVRFSNWRPRQEKISLSLHSFTWTSKLKQLFFWNSVSLYDISRRQSLVVSFVVKYFFSYSSFA